MPAVVASRPFTSVLVYIFGAVSVPTQVIFPFASSLHVSVYTPPPVALPTQTGPADCIMVDAYIISVLMEPKVAVPVGVKSSSIYSTNNSYGVN